MAEIVEVNASPLLTPPRSARGSPFGGARTSTTVSMLLGLFAGRRGASMIVRESAARQLEDWRDDWGYSLRVVVLDTLWNLVFMVVSIVVLFWTAREKPNVPLRVWICGYALQCAVHMALVWLEYRRRIRRIAERQVTGSGSSSEDLEDCNMFSDIKRWDKINTIISYLWWLVGFSWLLSSFGVLLHSAPLLFWLSVAFLAIDVFFAAIGFLMSLLLALAICFCFPCIIAFLYIVGRGEGGASMEDISILPKYRYEVSNDVGEGRMVPMETNGQDFSVERTLLTEDAECCICLCLYEDGAELHSLPCNHHFHVVCIVKWLKMKATCPLCKSHIQQIEQV